MRARPPPEMLRPDKREFRYTEFDGPALVERRCRDVLFLLLIILRCVNVNEVFKVKL